MLHSEKKEHNLIPLMSAEALWEWHIPSDRLFLSQGACHELGVYAEHIPTTMTDFISHIPARCLAKLGELRENALNGSDGSFLESTYPFDNIFVRERMFILGRDTHGRATWAMGQYVVSTTESAPLLLLTENMQEKIGFWLCLIEEDLIRIDARCAALLGRTAAPEILSLKTWKQLLYPKESRSPEAHRLQFIIEQALMGDQFEEKLPRQSEDGEYTHLMLRGSVLERDAYGKARSVTGTLQKIDSTMAFRRQQQENGRLLFALNATGDGLWDWDTQTNNVYFSPRYLSMLGYTAEQFPGRLDVWKEKICEEDRDKIFLPQQAIVESPRYGDTFECTYRLQRANGSWAWILGRGYVTHRNSAGRATRIVGMHTDVTTLQNGRAELEDLVKNDALTGLRSRTYCDMELERIEKDRIRPVSIIACDVCGLKLINDYMGHAEGDKLLNKAAMMLRQSLRATDCVARTGGDEFVILLPGCPESKAKKILTQIEHHFESHNVVAHDMPVLVSFGLASTETDEIPVARVLVVADRNMLHSKQSMRKSTHRRIKNWIERKIRKTVSLEDSRYES